MVARSLLFRDLHASILVSMAALSRSCAELELMICLMVAHMTTKSLIDSEDPHVVSVMVTSVNSGFAAKSSSSLASAVSFVHLAAS